MLSESNFQRLQWAKTFSHVCWSHIRFHSSLGGTFASAVPCFTRPSEIRAARRAGQNRGKVPSDHKALERALLLRGRERAGNLGRVPRLLGTRHLGPSSGWRSRDILAGGQAWTRRRGQKCRFWQTPERAQWTAEGLSLLPLSCALVPTSGRCLDWVLPLTCCAVSVFSCMR